jgi:hypothetical protein
MGGEKMSDPLQALLGPIFQARRQASPGFLAKDNVVACGVGYKIKGTQQTSTPSVIVSVTRKVPPDQLHPSALIPSTIQDVPTDVVETGEITGLAVSRTTAMRPARPGISVGNATGTTGTIGCIVRRGDQLFILSNNHVLGNLNDAHPGDPILQPGTADGGTLSDQVGTFIQLTPISFMNEAQAAAAASSAGAQSAEPSGCAAILQTLLKNLSNPQNHSTVIAPPPTATPANLVDAAIAAPMNNSLLDPNIVDIGSPPQGIAAAKLGMQVFKSGRTSGVTEGIVTQVDVDVSVKYGDQVARFSNQIMMTPFSQPGDSGSLILDFQRNAVALLFSGSNLVTVATPIQVVLTALNIELVTGAIAGAPPVEHG